MTKDQIKSLLAEQRYILHILYGCQSSLSASNNANMPTGQAYDDIVSYFEGMGLNGNFNLNQWNVFLINGPAIFVTYCQLVIIFIFVLKHDN